MLALDVGICRIPPPSPPEWHCDVETSGWGQKDTSFSKTAATNVAFVPNIGLREKNYQI
jgi:hypothetical protein